MGNKLFNIKLKELVKNGWKINEEDGTIKNPETGRNIKISTALSYAKDHPAYKAAVKMQGDSDTTDTDSTTSFLSSESQETANKINQFLEDNTDDIAADLNVDVLPNIKTVEEAEELYDFYQKEGQKYADALSERENGADEVSDTIGDLVKNKVDGRVYRETEDLMSYKNFMKNPKEALDAFVNGAKEYNDISFDEEEMSQLQQLVSKQEKLNKGAEAIENKYSTGGLTAGGTFEAIKSGLNRRMNQLEEGVKRNESKMKISKSRLREIVKEVIKEESDYQTFFKKALEKSGKSLGDMSDEEKKDFFNKIDKSWKGKGEKNEGNAFGAAVTKAKEQGKDSFEVGGKTYKVKEDITISKDDMEKLHTDKEIEVDGEKITYDESVVNEVTDKEMKSFEQLTKKLKRLRAEYLEITKMGDKELKDRKYNKTYEKFNDLINALNVVAREWQNEKLLNRESVVNEQSSNRDIMALSRMTGVPDYKIEAFLKRHRFKDIKKVKKLVKGMGIKKDEKFAKMVDGNFSLETEFKRMYKDL